MLKTSVLFSAMVITTMGSLSAQTPTPAPKPPKVYPSLGIGAGMLTFHGDVGKENPASAFSAIRSGYSLSVEQRIKNMLGISVNVTMGSLGKEQRSQDTTLNLNFETKFKQFGLGLTFYLDNGAIMDAEFPVAPYVFTGFNYFMGDVNTDLKDANGLPYYYWTDGSIRDLPEAPGNEFISRHIKRDYTFETSLQKGLTTFSIPAGLGFKLKVNKHIEVNLNTAWHITFSDEIDNKVDAGKDNYWYNWVGLRFHFGNSDKKAENERYSNVDWKAIMNMDEDGDGVTDTEDYCQGTEKGVKVNGKGCPPDADDDGVPDYKDKEADSKKGVAVDEHGIMLTDARIAELNRIKDSLSNVREQVVVEKPSTETLKEIDKQIVEQKKVNEQQLKVTSNIPAEFQSADTNKDGIISSSEINGMIDAFFDGSTDYTVEKIHRLIDFFFEQ
ncbi:MAG: hypothetical protein IT233_03280 [Bacteroidia bacterium]|nr:hypothetical protein [Bacteroidia bacterium]